MGVVIDNADLALYPDGVHDSTALHISRGSRDISIGSNVRSRSQNAAIMTHGIFVQTGNGAGVKDEVKAIGSKIADAYYAVYTVDAKQHIYKDLETKNCTNIVTNAGTLADVTSSGHVSY